MPEGKRARRDNELSKSSRRNATSDSDDEGGGADKNRMWRWPPELHNFFIQAYHELESNGQNPSPRRIMDVMEKLGATMKGLTLRQVQSHHQKYQKRLQQVRESGLGRQTNKGPEPMPVFLPSVSPLAGSPTMSPQLQAGPAGMPGSARRSPTFPFSFVDDSGQIVVSAGGVAGVGAMGAHASAYLPEQFLPLPVESTSRSPQRLSVPSTPVQTSPQKSMSQSPRSTLRSRLTEKLRGKTEPPSPMGDFAPGRPMSAPSVNLRGAGLLSAQAIRALSQSTPDLYDAYADAAEPPIPAHSSMPEFNFQPINVPRRSSCPSSVGGAHGFHSHYQASEDIVVPSVPAPYALRRSARSAAPASLAVDAAAPLSSSASSRRQAPHVPPFPGSAMPTPRSYVTDSGSLPSFGSYADYADQVDYAERAVGSLSSSASALSGSSLSSTSSDRTAPAPVASSSGMRRSAVEQRSSEPLQALDDSSRGSDSVPITASQERRKKREREVSLSDESLFANVKLLDLPNFFGMQLRSGTRISSGSSSSSMGDSTSSSSSRSLDSSGRPLDLSGRPLDGSQPVLSDSITEVTSMGSSGRKKVGSSGVSDTDMMASSSGARRSPRVSASLAASKYITRSSERLRMSVSSDTVRTSSEQQQQVLLQVPTRDSGSGRKTMPSMFASMSDLHVSQLRISTHDDDEADSSSLAPSASPSKARKRRGRRGSLRVSVGSMKNSGGEGGALISPDSMLISPNAFLRQTRSSGSRAPLPGVTPPSSVVPLTSSNNGIFDSVLNSASIISFQDTEEF